MTSKGDSNGQRSFPIPSGGILPLNKPTGRTSFSLVSLLRKITNIRTIGHAGTLDPFATGVMVLLIGKTYTRMSNQFLTQDKQYRARLHLGVATDTHDLEGIVTQTTTLIPSIEEIEKALLQFQGTILQVPPMFSAKKVEGKALYKLARKGISIERKPVPVTLRIEILSYAYPFLDLDVHCSKGTYIRSLAHDLGEVLQCGAHLNSLQRTRSGTFTIEECCNIDQLTDPLYPWQQHLRTSIA